MQKIKQEKQPEVKADDSLSEIKDDDDGDENEQFEESVQKENELQSMMMLTNKACESSTNKLIDIQPTNPSLNNFKLCSDIHSQSPEKTIYEMLHTKSSYFELAKAKQIFQRFICIGIDDSNLDSIEDLDELHFNPKITFNYPDNNDEQTLNFNIIYIKNSCFKEAVKVNRFFIDNDEELIMKVFERNFFADFKKTFCLLQPVPPNGENKYFIFGVQFDDLHIKSLKNSKMKNVFVYEKTYLFISHDPLCKLYENIMRFILSYKKLNFYTQLEEFSNLNNEERMETFFLQNNEKSSGSILEILQYFYNKSFPRHDEYFSFVSSYTALTLNYQHANQSNECFLALAYVCPILFKFASSDFIFTLLIKTVTEHNCLLISDNIQQLTSFILCFYYLIQPFTWPFTIIPNLPLNLSEIVESPVPFMIGVLGDKKTAEGFKKNPNVKSNIYLLQEGKLTTIENQPLNFNEPSLNNLKQVIHTNFSKTKYLLSQKMYDDYESSCEMVYKNIHALIKRELCEEIDRIIKETDQRSFYRKGPQLNIRDSCKSYNADYFEFVQNQFVLNQKSNNKEFASAFSQTQIFAAYVDKIILKVNKMPFNDK